MARMALEERKQIEQRILEISQQLRIDSEENLPGGNVPYELSKNEIDALRRQAIQHLAAITLVDVVQIDHRRLVRSSGRKRDEYTVRWAI